MTEKKKSPLLELVSIDHEVNKWAALCQYCIKSAEHKAVGEISITVNGEEMDIFFGFGLAIKSLSDATTRAFVQNIAKIDLVVDEKTVVEFDNADGRNLLYDVCVSRSLFKDNPKTGQRTILFSSLFFPASSPIVPRIMDEILTFRITFSEPASCWSLIQYYFQEEDNYSKLSAKNPNWTRNAEYMSKMETSMKTTFWRPIHQLQYDWALVGYHKQMIEERTVSRPPVASLTSPLEAKDCRLLSFGLDVDKRTKNIILRLWSHHSPTLHIQSITLRGGSDGSVVQICDLNQITEARHCYLTTVHTTRDFVQCTFKTLDVFLPIVLTRIVQAYLMSSGSVAGFNDYQFPVSRFAGHRLTIFLRTTDPHVWLHHRELNVQVTQQVTHEYRSKAVTEDWVHDPDSSRADPDNPLDPEIRARFSGTRRWHDWDMTYEYEVLTLLTFMCPR